MRLIQENSEETHEFFDLVSSLKHIVEKTEIKKNNYKTLEMKYNELKKKYKKLSELDKGNK